MRIHIHHITRYQYDRPVFLEPHVLRLTPRFDGAQRPEAAELQIDEPPAGITAGLDPLGNPVHHVWFEGLRQDMTITSTCTVANRRDNPFDFVLGGGATRLPMTYAPTTADKLRLCLARQPHADADPVGELARRVLGQVNGSTIDFCVSLTSLLYERIKVIVRPTGAAWSAERTLAEGTGACRDLTMLWVEACRAVGLAGRFVSGYELGGEQADESHLHAWAEVYLPGAGWRGFDPTHGLAVSNTHIALAAAPHPDGASPLTGTFRGTGATGTLHHDIDIKRID